MITFNKHLPFSAKQKTGTATIATSVIGVWALWLCTLKSYAFVTKDPFLVLSKIAILAGTICMCWTFICASRVKLLEKLFGGMDKVYHAHKNLGVVTFGCVILHVLFQIMRFLPDLNAVKKLIVPGTFNGNFFGTVSFVIFILLIANTLWIKVPYHVWKRIHSLFILVLIGTFLHIYLVDKHINASFVLSLYIYSFLFLAFLGYTYIRFGYYYLGPRYEYQVHHIEKMRKTWNVFLKPTANRALSFQPGQFVYIEFKNKKLGSESHPFSISSAPHQEFLRLSIKSLGDYTAGLDALNISDKALVWGPYGLFFEKYLYEKNTDAVFIAGGIGITPFLSMLWHEAHNPSSRKTYLFYCVKEAPRADFHAEIEQIKQLNPHIVYIPHCSAQKGLLDVPGIKQIIESYAHKNFFLCGPPPMMQSFISQLKRVGVKNTRIIYEDFNFL